MVQDGSRLRYAVPVALQRAGILESVFTEWYIKTPNSTAARLARALRRIRPSLAQHMLDRRNDELEAARVTTNVALMLQQELAQHCFRSRTAFHRWSSRRAGAWIRRRGVGAANAALGFVRNIDPDLCVALRQAGLVVAADQIIAPAVVEAAESAKQRELWPGWEHLGRGPDYRRISTVEEATWKAVHHVTCASEYVRDGLVAAGVHDSRITILPYPVAADAFPWMERSHRTGPLSVGFVGAVGLRKGAPYFLETARRLASPSLRFFLVGPVMLRDHVIADYRNDAEFLGAVPPSSICDWFRRFDILFLPSTCEGSAATLMEAMSTGLPVVTTPNSGTVARHGSEGFVKAYDDVEGLADSIARLASDSKLRHAMGRAAHERAASFDLDHYSQGLTDLFQVLLAAQSAPAPSASRERRP